MNCSTYKKFRNDVTKELRLAKAAYYMRLFEGYKSNMRKTWKTINEIIRPGDGSHKRSDPKIVVDGVELPNNEACEVFNEFFVNVGQNIADSIPPQLNWPRSMLPCNYQNSFYFTDVTSNEVKNIILNLKDKNCIPVKVLIYISDLISPIFAIIFNKSIYGGVLPNCLKIARVVPIFKGGTESNVGNYRPISVLPVFSKFFESKKIPLFNKQIYFIRLLIWISRGTGFCKCCY